MAAAVGLRLAGQDPSALPMMVCTDLLWHESQPFFPAQELGQLLGLRTSAGSSQTCDLRSGLQLQPMQRLLPRWLRLRCLLHYVSVLAVAPASQP